MVGGNFNLKESKLDAVHINDQWVVWLENMANKYWNYMVQDEMIKEIASEFNHKVFSHSAEIIMELRLA